MLHAPTCETKTETTQSKSQLAPQPERELHPHSFGAAGAYTLSGAGSTAPVRSPGAQRHQIFAGMQATHGNQAVLRMMQSSPQVVHMPALRPCQGVTLQRKCGCGGSSESTGECEECKAKREATLQRRAANQAASPSATNSVPPIVHDVLSSPGQALDAGTRAFVEPRFGHDFSRVRVHADEKAAESAQAVNALAYTVRQDIVFGTGQYKPETSEGRYLLAHELTHTIQQSMADQSSSLQLSPSQSEDQLEQQAESIARAVATPSLSSQQAAPIVSATASLHVARKEADRNPTEDIRLRHTHPMVVRGVELKEAVLKDEDYIDNNLESMRFFGSAATCTPRMVRVSPSVSYRRKSSVQ